MAGHNFERTVFFMDGARYHTSKKTLAELRQLGAFTIINAPQSPQFNCAEQFIRALKQKVKDKRDTIR